MTFRPRLVLWIGLSAACSTPGCGGARVEVTDPVTFSSVDYYPLREGNAWSYDVDTGEPSTTLAITRVEAVDGDVVQVKTAKAVVRYEARPEGIRVLPGDAWLIRAPLREGATWPARGGRTATLFSMHARIETPAGRFAQCMEVVELGGKLELEVRTIYCPGVGPVSITSTMRSKVSDRTLTVSARLRGFSVRPLARSDR
jgi:hypothetical protein